MERPTQNQSFPIQSLLSTDNKTSNNDDNDNKNECDISHPDNNVEILQPNQQSIIQNGLDFQYPDKTIVPSDVIHLLFHNLLVDLHIQTNIQDVVM